MLNNQILDFVEMRFRYFIIQSEQDFNSNHSTILEFDQYKQIEDEWID